MSSSRSSAISNNVEPVQFSAPGDETENPTVPNDSEKNSLGDDPQVPLNSGPELPKVWSIHDPFQFAPPKQDGDPWLLLLEPLLKKDKTRCDSWRDEVQNLLIFAGLFSAVVTAFIIESYKNLQPSTDQTMVALLSHIATRLDTPSNSSIPLSVPTFSPSASSIRVNAFWFVSLVLSLTTVLIGIICLQWLREHQTYSDLSQREIYAVHHMRHQALSEWHVPKFFTALPLLLQFALVLFLLGIVDFLRTFADSWAVTAPVAVLIGLTLTFLVATAVLPTLHTLSLYFNLAHEHNLPGDQGRGKAGNTYTTAPSPCPYKSPQSHAIRTVLVVAFRLCDYIYPRLRGTHHRIRILAQRIKYFLAFSPSSDFNADPPIPALQSETFTRYLRYASWVSRWVEFDVCWLAIRDGYMRRAYGRSAWFETVGVRDDEVPPLLDVVRALSMQSYHKATASAAYHCFSEVSEEALRPLTRGEYVYRSIGRSTEAIDLERGDKPSSRFLQSAYLHDLLEWTRGVADMFRMEALLRPDTVKTLHAVLHQQNLHAFTVTHYFGDTSLLSNHRKELSLRLSAYFYANSSEHTLTLRSKWNPNARNVDSATQSLESQSLLSLKQIRFPRCLVFTPFEALLEPALERGAFDAIAWRAAHTMHTIFQRLDALSTHTHTHTTTPLLLTPLVQKAGIPAFIQGAAYFTSLSIQYTLYFPSSSTSSSSSSHPDLQSQQQRQLQQALVAKHKATFDLITHTLSSEMDSWTSARAGSGPSVLFYVAALYANANSALVRIVSADDSADASGVSGSARKYDPRGVTANIDTTTSTTPTVTPSEALSSFTFMRTAIIKYKRRTIDMGVVDSVVEACLAEDEGLWREWDKRPFSDVWWMAFENGGDGRGGGGTGRGRQRDNVASLYSGIEFGRREDDIVVFYPF